MLVHLDKNKLALYGVGKDDLYDFMLNTARHAIVRWACREGGRPRPGLHGPDAEVAAMAAWIAAHSAAGKRGERQVTFRELVQAAARLPSAEAAEEASGTNRARQVRGSRPPRCS